MLDNLYNLLARLNETIKSLNTYYIFIYTYIFFVLDLALDSYKKKMIVKWATNWGVTRYYLTPSTYVQTKRDVMQRYLKLWAK